MTTMNSFETRLFQGNSEFENNEEPIYEVDGQAMTPAQVALQGFGHIVTTTERTVRVYTPSTEQTTVRAARTMREDLYPEENSFRMGADNLG